MTEGALPWIEDGEPEWLANRAIEALRSGHADGVEIRCYNKEEADRVLSLIPKEYRARIRVKWMTWTDWNDADRRS